VDWDGHVPGAHKKFSTLAIARHGGPHINLFVIPTLQDRVYKTKVNDVEELRQRIVNEWEHLDQHIDIAIRQSCKRLQACVAAKGGQFEHEL